jgi:hypothetical protein
MDYSRRQALLTTLFGAGYVGLRTLATGLPASLLLNPRKALASGCASDAGACSPTAQACSSTPGTAQYFIMSTSGAGDPICQNAPGTYLDSSLMHAPTGQGPGGSTTYNPITNPSSYNPSGTAGATSTYMAPTQLTLNGQAYSAAYPWSWLQTPIGGVNFANRTVFFHMATNSTIHPAEPQVLELNGAANNEMLPSLLAKATTQRLCTVQQQPVSIGAATPSEALSFDGSVLPILPPQALADTLLNPVGPLTQLQAIRDKTMNTIYGIYKQTATPAQQQYIDQLVTSQVQVRALSQCVVEQLACLSKDPVMAQIQAAIVLIQLQVTPLVSIHIPFGGDNHSDKELATEAAETNSGVYYITQLLQALQSAKDAHGNSLQDQVTFMTLNVFGRTFMNNGQIGRGHNGNYQGSVVIGKPFQGGVIGGVTAVNNAYGNDFGATSINSTTGASGGDVDASDTLDAYAMTMLQAVGGDPTVVQGSSTAKPILGALAP